MSLFLLQCYHLREKATEIYQAHENQPFKLSYMKIGLWEMNIMNENPSMPSLLTWLFTFLSKEFGEEFFRVCWFCVSLDSRSLGRRSSGSGSNLAKTVVLFPLQKKLALVAMYFFAPDFCNTTVLPSRLNQSNFFDILLPLAKWNMIICLLRTFLENALKKQNFPFSPLSLHCACMSVGNSVFFFFQASCTNACFVF